MGAGVVAAGVIIGLGAATEGLAAAGLSDGAGMAIGPRTGEAGGERDDLTAMSR